MKFLIHFAQVHPTFRLPELESVILVLSIQANFDRKSYCLASPFLIIDLPDKESAIHLANRSVFIKDIYELWGAACDYPSLVKHVRRFVESNEYASDQSWRFLVETFNQTITLTRRREIVEMFSFMRLNGPVALSDSAQLTFGVFEDHSDDKHAEYTLFMGLWVARGGRDLVQKYNLKKRKYLGTTSMDAELSLVMANQALLKPGKLVLDPFVGTGSFLCTSAEFGAYTMGADIDGRQIRGRTKLTYGRTKGIQSNIEQYNLQKRVLDSVVRNYTLSSMMSNCMPTQICDNSNHPWRTAGEYFDAIITDPPYGVRAGAKKIGGQRNPKYYEYIADSGQDCYPAVISYEMADVIRDLIEFAAQMLRTGGRLVFWMPTVTAEYSVDDIPYHSCLELVADSEQDFGKWQRRLITMQKIRPYDPSLSITFNEAPAHADFRRKYFDGFSQVGK